MIWRILPHATACIAADRVYLLDIRQDRYLQVPGDQTAATAWLHLSDRSAPPQHLVSVLRRAGTLRSQDPDPTNASSEIVEIPPDLTPAARPSKHAHLGGATMGRIIVTTSLSLKWRPLAQQLSARARANDRLTDEDVTTQGAIAARFDIARRFVPLKRGCLLDSLALRRCLERAGQRSRLVFGVAGPSFAAHCWLQNSVSIVNDSYDRVSRFTPILAL